MAASLDVYVESRHRFGRTPMYKLAHMLKALDEVGLAWRAIDRGEVADPAPAAFFHVDLTDVPEKFHNLPARYARHINGDVRTIRRTLYSTARLNRDNVHSGPVIVKTVLNSRGEPEARYEWRQTAAGWMKHFVRRSIDRQYLAKACPDYRVFDSLADVPEEVWTDDRLIVERFLVDDSSGPIVKHRYEFFQDVDLVTRATYTTALCDPGSVIDMVLEDAPPAEVAAVRQRLSLDFGAIDYFETEDGVHVIDANKTITWYENWIRKFPSISEYMVKVKQRFVEFVRG